MSTTRKLYLSDVTDAEWEFLVPYLTLMREDAPQRDYPLRELFNAMLRDVVKMGCQWRFLPYDVPLFETIAHDLRIIALILGT
jgi:transposase